MTIPILLFAAAVIASAPAPAPAPQQPAQSGGRGTRPTGTGTGVIRGRVFAADTGRPLRRARVFISAAAPVIANRTDLTGPDGRFEFKELPAARYAVSVQRGGYLTAKYGQRRPLEEGTPLDLADRQVVENADFSLTRTSSIAGRATDEAHDPLAGVRVLAMRSAYAEGRRGLVSAGDALTDEAGEYEILDLAPGSYYVFAILRETWPVTERGVERVLAYAPTFLPGTTNAADAQRVTLGVGEDLDHTDVSLLPAMAASISGTAVDSRGRPLTGQTVFLSEEFTSAGGTQIFQYGGPGSVAADGTFTIKDLAPGQYKLSTRASVVGKTGEVREQAAVTVPLNGVEARDVALKTSAGWTATGSIVTEGGALPGNVRRFHIAARSVNPEVDPRSGNEIDVAAETDGTFSLAEIYGAARLRATVADGWAVNAILHDGQDITDSPVEMRSGEELGGVQVIVTDRVTTVTGQVTDDKGAPLADRDVIVFPADQEKWSAGSRFVRTVRSDQTGQWHISGLPAGPYLAVAVVYVQEGMANDPEYLDLIRRYARSFSLADGGSETLSLKVVTPQ